MGAERQKENSYLEQARAIIKERTPNPEEVIYEPTVEFLDPEGSLSREERGRVIAMGDRTAIAYRLLAEKVISDREKGDGKTSSFYLAYALAARSSNEIAHTSILEQVNAGPDEFGGDSPVVIEGITVLTALRDICSLRHFGFEAFSSRGAVFPEGYWRIPKELHEAGIGQDLEKINQAIYQEYLHLATRGAEYYLKTLEKKEDEKDWQFRWRVLNHALDDARQVTNQSFLNHLSMHPNSALSLREAIVALSSSQFLETREIANWLRELAEKGLPTLMRYTEASPFTTGLPEKRKQVLKKLGIWEDLIIPEQENKLVTLWTPIDAERTFLAAFLANHGKLRYDQVVEVLKTKKDREITEAIAEIFDGLSLHDKPPKELEMVQVTATFEMSVGAFYEQVRHRLATHLVGQFTPFYGQTTPEIYEKLGLDRIYNTAVFLSEQGYMKIANLGQKYEEAFGPLFVARAHLVPVTMRISGLDLFHFLKLRASKSAHPDISGPSHGLEEVLRKNIPGIFNHLVKK